MKKSLLFLGVISLFLLVNSVCAQTVNVTFSVDMQEQTVSGSGVHIAGSFPAPLPTWNPSGIMLDPPISGSVYTVTLALNINSTVEFKYINGNAWGQDENLNGFPCTMNNNRFVQVGENDTILPVVCFAKCVACILPEKNITFQVDMSNETVTGNVYLAGFFNNWNPTATQLTNQGNGIYSTVLQLGEGEYVEYKYINGANWEGVPASCAVNGNRFYTVPSNDETIPLHCFGSCDPCSSVVPVNVTFRVDMSEQVVVPEGVHIAGSFQGWNTAGTLMDDNGNGIWSKSFVLQSGSYHEYKFLNGDAWGEDESVPAGCAQNNNRFITIPENDTILPAVCYGSCVVCIPPTVNVKFSVDMSTQIVSGLGVHLAGNFQGWDPGTTQMTHVGGNVYEVTLPVGIGEVHEYKFVNGNDWPGAETVPGECASFDGNRVLVGPSVNTVLPTVCFNECGECTSTLYTFNLKVLLEGPFNGTGMNTTLFDNGQLPANQPYNDTPWNYDGQETLTALPGSGVVDFVLVEIRETIGDATTATSDKMIDRQAAVLLADGTVARPDGSPNIYFTANIVDNLYLVIHHRNHLSIMSAVPLTESAGTFNYNFTDAQSKAYLSAQTELSFSSEVLWGMFGGDSDGSGGVTQDDKDVNWNSDAGVTGYYGSDLNLDGQVNNPDKNEIWEPNQGEGTQVPL